MFKPIETYEEDYHEPRWKTVLLVLLVVVIAFVTVYKAMPTSQEVYVSLHTGERHTIHKLGAFTVAESYSTDRMPTWVKTQQAMDRSEQRWILESSRRTGWFGRSTTTRLGSPVVPLADATRNTIERLATHNSKKATKALQDYDKLIAELDPAAFQVEPEAHEYPDQPVARQPHMRHMMLLATNDDSPLAELNYELNRHLRYFY